MTIIDSLILFYVTGAIVVTSLIYVKLRTVKTPITRVKVIYAFASVFLSWFTIVLIIIRHYASIHK